MLGVLDFMLNILKQEEAVKVFVLKLRTKDARRRGRVAVEGWFRVVRAYRLFHNVEALVWCS